ncbi:MAG: glycosyltransferase family 4 protein [bacterium]|jgi:glycosyltransferase involved in cell wall biosynthesis|nr:glycosyltransferase family 4 protein [bacterium]
MKILIVDKTAGLYSSHERHQALGSLPGVDLHVVGPRHWIESGRVVAWTPTPQNAYTSYLGRVFGKDYYARVGYYNGLGRALRQAQPDIIQLLEEPWSISALQTVYAAALFAPTARILFYTWENIYRPWTYPSRASWLYAKIDKTLHCVSSGAVCATVSALEVLRQKGYGHPAAVIPYGIPSVFFAGGIATAAEPRPFTIGYVGRFLYMKGIDLLLEALAQLPECRLLLVGSGDEEESFRQKARQFHIADRVDWMQPLAEHRIPDVLQRMDVFVLPSRTMPHWCEQLGRAAIEAMAVGLPVIGANSGAIPEVLGEVGLVFEENQARDLAEKIRNVMADPERRFALSRAGQARARAHFTWDRFARDLYAFYIKVLEG